MSKKIGIIFAGGSGSRMGNNAIPKQFLLLNGKPIIIHTIEYFQNNPNIDEVYVCSIAEGIAYLQSQVNYYQLNKVKAIIPGGTSGQDSIYLTLLEAKKHNDDDAIVLIHDGVRPYITQEVINRNIESVEQYGSAITCTNCYETIVTSDNGQDVQQVPYRRHTFTAQAPQSFRLKDIIAAHQEIRKSNPNYTDIVDSCTMFKYLNIPTHIIEGNKGNIKVTYPEDFYLIKALFDFRESQEILGMQGNDNYFTKEYHNK